MKKLTVLIVTSLLLALAIVATFRNGRDEAVSSSGANAVERRRTEPDAPTAGFDREEIEEQRSADDAETANVQRIDVQVIDSVGAPLPSVEISKTVEAATEQLVGRTSAEGLISLPPERIGYVARKIGYKPQLFLVGGASDVPLVVVMQRALRAAGVVVRHDGTPVGRGVNVMAMRYPESWTAEAVAGAIRTASGERFAITDDSGRFELILPGEDQKYRLVAGGGGFISRSALESVVPGSDTVELKVDRAYGAWLRIRDTAGGPPRVSPALYGTGYGTVSSGASGSFSIPASSPQLGLLGVPASDLGGGGFFDRLSIVASRDSAPLLGPLKFAASFPGYKPIDQAFEMPALEHGIGEIQMEAERMVSCFGSLRINVEGAFQPVTSENQGEPVFVVQSEAVGGTDPGGIALWGMDLPKASVGPIPCGPRRFWIVDQSGRQVWPRTDADGVLTVREDEPVEINMGLSDYGACLTTVLVEGVQHEGYAVITFSSKDGGGDFHRVFKRAPFVAYCLPQGAYDVYINQPRTPWGLERARRAAVPVVISQGALVELQLNAPPKQ